MGEVPGWYVERTRSVRTVFGVFDHGVVVIEAKTRRVTAGRWADVEFLRRVRVRSGATDHETSLELAVTGQRTVAVYAGNKDQGTYSFGKVTIEGSELRLDKRTVVPVTGAITVTPAPFLGTVKVNADGGDHTFDHRKLRSPLALRHVLTVVALGDAGALLRRLEPWTSPPTTPSSSACSATGSRSARGREGRGGRRRAVVAGAVHVFDGNPQGFRVHLTDGERNIATHYGDFPVRVDHLVEVVGNALESSLADYSYRTVVDQVARDGRASFGAVTLDRAGMDRTRKGKTLRLEFADVDEVLKSQVRMTFVVGATKSSDGIEVLVTEVPSIVALEQVVQTLAAR